MYSAIIFDCFGVLATEGWLAFKQKYFGNKPEYMERATELSHLLDSGLIRYSNSLNEISAMAGVPPEELDRILKNVVPNEELLDYIATHLKQKYKIGLLSNVSDDWLYTLFDEDQVALFDAKVLSHEIGVIKPHPKAYEAIAEKLGVKPEECVFIDDQKSNVEGAKAVGMQAFQYTTVGDLITELDNLA